MVKLTKNIFYGQLQDIRLTMEKLTTALVEVEAVINSRPLAPLSSEVTEGVLTPSMLLTGFNITSIPDELEDKHCSPASRWRK
ncbi:Uncharacterized protein FKW44_010130 [Caligus rogercresseyi]|uniref:Uncharacterized protein n=1 Tax=Caligus rogercresseyi TaxID=217165 RepID=A0A7T8K8S6_CALRO|nr:Uncharacterized protein FKW44_010130 [Caligus rogercresseyi]